MSKFRIWFKIMGGHVHMRVFCGLTSNSTLGKAGDLTMTLEEFDDFKRLSPAFQFINEQD